MITTSLCRSLPLSCDLNSYVCAGDWGENCVHLSERLSGSQGFGVSFHCCVPVCNFAALFYLWLIAFSCSCVTAHAAEHFLLLLLHIEISTGFSVSSQILAVSGDIFKCHRSNLDFVQMWKKSVSFVRRSVWKWQGTILQTETAMVGWGLPLIGHLRSWAAF